MAINHVGRYVHEQRFRHSLSYGDLARGCGATSLRQISRMAQRLVRLEHEGVSDRELLQKVITALDLDIATVNALLRRQRDEEIAEWIRWADQVTPMELRVRPFGGFWFKRPLPESIARDVLHAMEHARTITIGREDMLVVLTVSRRIAYIFARGQLVERREAIAPDQSLTPFVTMSGQDLQFETGE